MEKYTYDEYLSRILNLIESVEYKKNAFLKKYSFQKCDTRKTFFEQLNNALRVYYLGVNNIYIVNKVVKNVDFSNLVLSEFEKKHIENSGWLLLEEGNKEYLNTYSSILKQNLLNNCWICFESTLRDINKKLKLKSSEDFIPVNTIYSNKRFKVNKDFLNFFRYCRNAIHNNSIYTNESQSYVLKEKVLCLEKKSN